MKTRLLQLIKLTFVRLKSFSLDFGQVFAIHLMNRLVIVIEKAETHFDVIKNAFVC